MKSEFIDLTDTRKNLLVEIPSEVVEAEIARVAKSYSRAARIPGFRPGKVPPRLVRQRFRDQILHDVAHGLIPRAVDEALRDRGVEPVDTPDIREVVLEEGQPLRFTATFETIPPIDPGDYESLTIRRPPVTLDPAEVDRGLERLRDRAARYEPIEGRPAARGDTVVADLERQPLDAERRPAEQVHRHENIAIELGAEANPPGFDDELAGSAAGEVRTFTVEYPADYAIGELAGTRVQYTATIKALKQRVLPALDDELAKDLGDFDSLEALRRKVEETLRREAEEDADRQARADLARQLAGRVPFETPEALVDREIDRRVEEFVRRLIEQRIDPTQAGINWEEFRERQREPAAEAVRAALVLDEIARRERLLPDEAEVGRQIDRYAAQSGRTAAAVRARLEQEGGMSRLEAGLRREKAVDFLLTRARIVPA